MGTTLDKQRTYAADADMKGDARKLAEKGSRDAERLKAQGQDGDDKERHADDALASTAGQTGQS